MGRSFLASLTPGQWERLKPMLDQALDMPRERREDWLSQTCGDDRVLRRQIDALLQASEQPEQDLLEAPLASLLEPESEALAIGERVDRYRILRRLGHGGVGTVYLARDGHGESVAIKVLRRGLDTEAILRRFEQERRILARLDHPGIVRLHGAGSLGDGRPFLIMEFVDGVPIDRHCAEHDLDLADRLRIMTRVADAVEAAHVAGIIHRDLKPGNILITADGRPKLLDFGIARSLEPGSHLTRELGASSSMMTPAYASPEQLLGDEAGPASDVYSLGVLLWELTSGRALHLAPENRRFRLLQGPETIPSLASASRRDPSCLTACPRTVRRRLDALIRRALTFGPDRRHRSVRELIIDLEALIKQLRADPHSPCVGDSSGRAARRRHGMILAVGAIVFALGGWSGWRIAH